jgi:PAS domain S-box-containing protein
MVATKKQESLYVRSLLEASLDILVTISAEGKITDVNEALVKVTGVSRKKLIGTDFSHYFTDPQNAQVGYQRVFEKGFVSDYPLTIKHKNGKLTDVSYNASVYKDAEGNVLGIFAAARDVTEQKWAIELRIANKELAFQNNEKEKRAQELIIANKELAFQNDEKEKRAAELIIANKELVFQTGEKEKRAAELVIAGIELEFQNAEKDKREIANKELERLSYSAKLAYQYSHSLIEATLDPLVTINTKGKITDINLASVKITGVPRDELKGTDFFEYFTEPQKAREVYQEVFANGSVKNSPLTLRHKEGKLTDVLFNGSVYKDDRGRVLGVVIVARDVTEQKRIASELLEAKVSAELATSISEEAKIKAESATSVAESAVKAKQQFLSNMSHEIRTPMNAIIGFTKIMFKTELTAKQKEYLTAIELSGNSLIVLINDILDLAKVDAGKMTFEKTPFRMASSISAMLYLFEIKVQEKNLLLIKEYDDNIPDVLLGDPARLHQIILNLVSNAVKFTSTGKIVVNVRLIDEDEENVKIEFSISDTGIGIALDKLEQIFDNFQQESTGTSRLYGGTGLGLAIVKQLVEAQGGCINVESTIGVGSNFRFILNFQKTDEDAAIDTELFVLDDEIKNIKVLVVEDIPLNQLLMKTLLDDFGFERDVASNGKIAIEMLKEKSYDIILMDLQMPEMNGFEATQHIREKMHSNIPIIALTADVTTVDLKKCKAVGMNDYAAKPVDEKLLYSKIVGLVIKPSKPEENEKPIDIPEKKVIDMTNLRRLTKSNSETLLEMIELYLEQTPRILKAMREGLSKKDWGLLQNAVHKLIPSFSIVGIHHDYEKMARDINELAKLEKDAKELNIMISNLESICGQACTELQEEYKNIKTAKDEN